MRRSPAAANERCQRLRAEGGRLFDAGDEAGANRRMSGILAATENDSGAPAGILRFQALVSMLRYEEAFALGERILDLPSNPQIIMGFWQPWAGHDVVECRDRHLAVLEPLTRGAKTRYWALFYKASLLHAPGAFAFLRRWPERARLRYGWMNHRAAWVSLQSGLYPEAFRLFRTALRCNPQEWRIHALMAEGHICLGEPDKALACMRRAEALAPPAEAAQASAWLGQNLLWLERYRPALAVLEHACRQGAVWAFCWRGAAKLRLGRVGESLADFDTALELNPHDREASLWRGEAYRLLGRHRESLRDLGREPVPVWARLNRALVYDAMGDFARMRREFRLLPQEIEDLLLRRIGRPGLRGLDDETRRSALRAGLAMGPLFRTNRRVDVKRIGAPVSFEPRPEGLSVEVERDDARAAQKQGQLRRSRRERRRQVAAQEQRPRKRPRQD